MKKYVCCILALVLLCIAPVYATDSTESIENENKKIVDELLPGFYSNNNYQDYEIYYGDDLQDRKDLYLRETKELYENGMYDRVLEYNVINDISVVKTEIPVVNLMSIATRPISKTVSKTYSVDDGGVFKYGTVKVTFSGSYTYNTGDEEITGVSASASISKPSNFAAKNAKFSKSYTATKITLTETMDVVITISSGTTITYRGQKFVATIIAN